MNFYVIKEIETGSDGEECETTTVCRGLSVDSVRNDWNRIYIASENVSPDNYNLAEGGSINLHKITAVYEPEYKILERFITAHQISLN